MLPQVMPAAVQVLRLYRQNVVGIQVSSHLQQQAQNLYIVVKRKRKEKTFCRQFNVSYRAAQAHMVTSL